MGALAERNTARFAIDNVLDCTREQNNDVPTHFADRLLTAIREKNAPVCVGFDPVLENLPAPLRSEFGIADTGDERPLDEASRERAAGAILAFGRQIVDVIAPFVPAIKINIAFFEPYDDPGLRAYHGLVQLARKRGLIVIGDIKRADIGHSAERYARAHLARCGSGVSDRPDAVTVNPYFGFDGVRPFVDVARREAAGVFVLVQTSDASAKDVQDVRLAGGPSVAEHIAAQVHQWAVADGNRGQSGYSCVGAVVSPRDPASTRRLRTLMPCSLFLVPGFGAQGRTADDVALCFRPEGTGAIVNASRSIIYAYRDAPRSEGDRGWPDRVRRACEQFADTMRSMFRR